MAKQRGRRQRPSGESVSGIRRDTFEMGYYNTYYHANLINNIINHQVTYLRTLHDLVENDGHLLFCAPFPKHTALHRFATFCIELDFFEDLSSDEAEQVFEGKEKLLPINRAMVAHGIQHQSLEEWMRESGKPAADLSDDDLYDYLEDLRLHEEYDTLMKQITDEVFFLMFLNRDALTAINSWIASHVQHIEIEELP